MYCTLNVQKFLILYYETLYIIYFLYLLVIIFSNYLLIIDYHKLLGFLCKPRNAYYSWQTLIAD